MFTCKLPNITHLGHLEVEVDFSISITAVDTEKHIKTGGTFHYLCKLGDLPTPSGVAKITVLYAIAQHH